MNVTIKPQVSLLIPFVCACVKITIQTVVIQTRHHQSTLVKHFTFGLLLQDRDPAQVKSQIGNTRLVSSQYTQQTNKESTTLNYALFSRMNMSQVQLYADGPC